MTAMLPILMAYELVGETAHEWVGLAMFVLFILHHILNYKWHQNLLKGRYSGIRILGTAIDMLLIVVMVCLPVSGIMMSRHVFVFLPIRGSSTALIRTMHLLSSYWGFVLMSVHLGLHWNMFMGVAKKSYPYQGACQYSHHYSACSGCFDCRLWSLCFRASGDWFLYAA